MIINLNIIIFSELGLMNVHIPQEYGGLGLGAVDCSIICMSILFTCVKLCSFVDSPNPQQLNIFILS